MLGVPRARRGGRFPRDFAQFCRRTAELPKLRSRQPPRLASRNRVRCNSVVHVRCTSPDGRRRALAQSHSSSARHLSRRTARLGKRRRKSTEAAAYDSRAESEGCLQASLAILPCSAELRKVAGAPIALRQRAKPDSTESGFSVVSGSEAACHPRPQPPPVIGVPIPAAAAHELHRLRRRAGRRLLLDERNAVRDPVRAPARP